MMRSLFTAVSGLSNHQTRMDVISNNIANVNTVGFKASRVMFSDTLSQTVQGATAPGENTGGVNAKQIGLGVKTSSIDILFNATSFQTTNQNTDLAINNDGFFIVNNGAQSYYTRAGNFKFDANGNMVTNEGLFVQGWLADAAGYVNTSADTTNISVPVTATMAPRVSTYIDYAGNLQANGNLADTTTTSVTTYDSQGYAHKVSTTYTKLDDNIWLAYSSVSGAQDGSVTGNTKILQFDTHGNLQSVNDAQIPGNTTPYIELTSQDTISLNFDSTLPCSDSWSQVYTDSTGGTVILDYLVDWVSGTGANDAKFDITVSHNGVALDTITVDANNKPAFGTHPVTNSAGDLVSITPNFSYTGGAAVDTVIRTGNSYAQKNGETITGILNGIAITLDSNASLGEVLESGFAFVDSNGVARALAIKATCTKAAEGGNPAEWKLEFIENGKTVGSSTYNSAGPNELPTLTLVDGTLCAFDSSYGVVLGGSNSFDLSAITRTAATNLVFQPTDGTAGVLVGGPMSVSLSYEGLTQYASTNTVNGLQDGYAAGTLEDKVIDASGMIIGKFSNGQALNLAQVALAIFNNQQGLERVGSTLFAKSNNSGEPIIGTAGTGGRGTMQAGVLEMANVDLADEFTNMIITQRGYQSNSRIITTSDELLQELVNLKR